MEQPTGIIPEELMYPQKKREVIAFLMAAPAPGDWKRRVLEGWVRWVGIQLTGAEYRRVEASGIDH